MTNGVVSITRGRTTIMKIVTGMDGMFAERFALALKGWHDGLRDFTEEEVMELAESVGFGKGAESLTVVSADRIINRVDGDVSNEPSYVRYRETFPDPEFNPRWECGLASYVYFLDVTSGNVVRIYSESTE